MVRTFERALAMMRKRDAQTREDGFYTLKPVASDFLDELMVAFEAETDHGLKCWLLELVGAARSEKALPLLTRELTSDDESLRLWATYGLKELNTKAARTVLWENGRSTSG